VKRRQLLQTASLVAGGMLIPVGLNSWVKKGIAQTNNSQRLVVIFLRGAIDGLNLVIPHQDTDYYEVRPTIAVSYPKETDGALDLDGFFGLNPDLKDLIPLWKQKTLAFVHCCGSPNETRSHFDAQDYMESGTPGIKSTSDGWMNRLLANLPHQQTTQAVNVGNTTPHILKGAMEVANLAPGKSSTQRLPVDIPSFNKAFQLMYDDDSAVSKAYQEGIEARRIILEDLKQEMDYSSRGASLADKFVDDAIEVAKLMVGDAKTQLAFMDVGGWDTHINERSVLKRYLPSLGQGLASLVRELGDLYSETTIVVMSEFGRTVKENGNEGTDHGHGNVMWLLGGNIKGGKVYGDWKGLSESDLYEQRDLPITTDFREPISSILAQQMSLDAAKIAKIFPGYQSVGNLNILG
jgi:uncharacterized protein (DUF1501 family)